MRASLLVVLGLFSAASVMAKDVPGSSDLSGIERYPNAYIVDFKNEAVNNHQMVTGPIKKINGVVRADSEFRENGDVTRIVYRIPEGHSNRDAFRYYQEQMAEQGYTTLYRCEQRRCGSSNYWANQVFGIAQLYGPDNAQFYQIVENPESPGIYMAVYAIRRGNGRVFLMLERFVGADSRENIKSDGVIDISGWPVEPIGLSGSELFLRLQNELKGVSGPVVLVVSISSAATVQAELDEVTRRSRKYADVISDLLVKQGMSAERIAVLGVGPALLAGRRDEQVLVRVIAD